MYNRVTFWGSMFCAFLSYTTLTLGIPIANAQIFRPSLVELTKDNPVSLTNLILTEVPCSTFLQPYFDWAKGSSINSVSTTVAFNNVKDGLVTYSTGKLRQNGYYLTGDLKKLLSNRFISLPGVPGGFGGPSQPFSINEPASVSMTLAADGSVTWVERSFNNATSNYRAVCYSNNTAILLPLLNGEEAAGVITFQKVREPIVN
ncbi:hypothetical protein KBT16_29605 [Nostoc sp. CCCryo 231-06]|nr:hypothetical protein [Nostoc sp. CCCryo 231-06]